MRQERAIGQLQHDCRWRAVSREQGASSRINQRLPEHVQRKLKRCSAQSLSRSSDKDLPWMAGVHGEEALAGLKRSATSIALSVLAPASNPPSSPTLIKLFSRRRERFLPCCFLRLSAVAESNKLRSHKLKARYRGYRPCSADPGGGFEACEVIRHGQWSRPTSQWQPEAYHGDNHPTVSNPTIEFRRNA